MATKITKEPSVKERLKAIQEARKNYEQLMKKLGYGLVKDMTQEFLAKHSNVQAIRWAQFTPYFNDGDACVFGINEPTVQFFPDEFAKFGEAEKNALDICEDGDEEDGSDGFYLVYSWKTEGSGTLTKMAKDLDKLYKSLQELESVLLEAFGDHTEVVVTRGEDKIETSHYSHD